uniref:Uncharacterized protein n=1 Tax=Rhizophora mucronata TaxID=61149 RepID=A0A2P2K8L5_RHIMU
MFGDWQLMSKVKMGQFVDGLDESKFIFASHCYVSDPWKCVVATFLNNLEVSNLQKPNGQVAQLSSKCNQGVPFIQWGPIIQIQSHKPNKNPGEPWGGAVQLRLSPSRN